MPPETDNMPPKSDNMPPQGKPSIKKSAVFFNIVQKAFDPPPFRLNIMHSVLKGGGG